MAYRKKGNSLKVVGDKKKKKICNIKTTFWYLNFSGISQEILDMGSSGMLDS